MALRLPVAIVLAFGVTLFLFWAMQALIGVEGELGDSKPSPKIEFVRLKRDTTPEEKKREPPKREKPDTPPPPPDISTSKASLNPGEGVGVLAPSVDPGEALSGGIGTGAGADRDVVPLVRIEPDYPIRARQRGIEGWVVVGFTISKVGSIKNARVVAANPPDVFNKAAVQAVRKWKYNPKIKEGVPVERSGIQVRLDFEME
jgi:protein TonB